MKSLACILLPAVAMSRSLRSVILALAAFAMIGFGAAPLVAAEPIPNDKCLECHGQKDLDKRMLKAGLFPLCGRGQNGRFGSQEPFLLALPQ